MLEWKHALSYSGSKDKPLTPEEEAILDKIARKVVAWRMTAPAIMFLETSKPLSFLGSQAMVFLEPIIQSLFSFKDYDTVRKMMEERQNVERLLLKIEQFDAEVLKKEKEFKAQRIKRQTLFHKIRQIFRRRTASGFEKP